MQEAKFKRGRVELKRLAQRILPARTGWEDHAKCYGEDTNVFVYANDEPGKKARAKLEKICQGCPVMITCRLEAIRQHELGWWGGMSERERMAWAFDNFNDENDLGM